MAKSRIVIQFNPFHFPLIKQAAFKNIDRVVKFVVHQQIPTPLVLLAIHPIKSRGAGGHIERGFWMFVIL